MNKDLGLQEAKREATLPRCKATPNETGRSTWIKYWRGRICDAMDTTDPILAAHQLDAVIVELWQSSPGPRISTPKT